MDTAQNLPRRLVSETIGTALLGAVSLLRTALPTMGFDLWCWQPIWRADATRRAPLNGAVYRSDDQRCGVRKRSDCGRWHGPGRTFGTTSFVGI